jgi:hypothetical protein
MRLIGLAAALCLPFVCAAPAAELGSFTSDRLLEPQHNLLDGTATTTARAVLSAAGVNVTLTDTVTPEFLSTMDVFCTSFIATSLPSSAEVQAMADWVQAGGVLLVTCHCA